VGQMMEQAQSTNDTKMCQVRFTCKDCEAPSYSFVPGAQECSQCPPKASCKLNYALPQPGSYQSHPRNPLVSALTKLA
jgi:hypothetical protein